MTKQEVVRQINNIKSDTVYLWYKWYIITLKKDSVVFNDLHMGRPQYPSIWYEHIYHITDNKPFVLEEAAVNFGSDPEFFFVKDNKVVPSTEIVPDGMETVTQDGFQGELNPLQSTCRQTAGTNIAIALEEAEIYARKAGAELSFEMSHIISDDVWKNSPRTLKRFGCNPTTNVHEESFVRVTGMREKFRAAGGHIHCGIRSKTNLPELVTLMDIIGGNTCVLVDRHPNNARRRKNYGRAGEYRRKPYGLEYRVYSNFWLKSYTLWSFASVLLRQAVSIKKQKLSKQLIARFNMADVRKAINNNDTELALKNFKILVEFFKEKNIFCESGLSVHNIDKTLEWLSTEDPISYIPCHSVDEIMEGWADKIEGGGVGFESFIKSFKI